MIWLINMFILKTIRTVQLQKRYIKKKITLIPVAIVLTAVWLLQTNQRSKVLLQHYAQTSKIEDFDYC